MDVKGQHEAQAALSLGGKKYRHPLNKRPGRPQRRFGPCGEEMTLLSLPGFEPGPCSPQHCRHTDCAIPTPGIKWQPTTY